MESTEKKEALMRIKAASKNELYRKLFDQYGTDYYYVVDESVKRNIPFFWKKNYEMLVAFPEDKQEEVNEGTAQFHEQLMDVVNDPSEQIVKANGIQSVLHNLENVTTTMSYAAMQTGNSEEWTRKKEKLLKLFEKGIVVVKQTEETKVAKVTKKQKTVKKVVPVKKEEVVVKKENQESVPFIIQKVIRMLEQNDVEQYFIHAYAEKLKVKFENATMITEEEVIGYILEDMRSHFNTENVFEKEVQTIALIGPTGVGKTTTLAKMAWQFHGKKKTVGFITTDHSRIGTVQQLQDYVKTIGFEVIAVRDEAAMTRALTYFKEEARVDYILIDTAGKNYRASETVEEMIETMGQVEPDYICLTLSASMKSKDMIEIITNFKDIHIDGIVFTKFDETASSGELLKIPAVSSAPIVLMTDGQDVKQHIHIATAEHLAKQMLQTS
ncbi:TPA: flagellar biosynthesis protein FlhF [Bacillus wiedmannii]|uniref:flagellar biosynthesis protein FlhF n=1 Tax=Bacillus wiedmannii TaxID=1890302 RepID=UPI000BF276FE|nr:flagellar biosynthesis protein FlhF [Bacillus wiedmannii]PGD58299.1 flagellar biosynthesis protein FlhF [Bacillus wiedmannii]PHA25347.1 flagellar biosynthesis protein FlhF [Bacillus wiedmannii]PHB14310.1 flagellar biosynthesis protein FlhF [Bacillus wiedmannii]HDR7669363.1 flagellar biosynthesis protein FlhF [Bacillus wiedmannii]HDR7941909.1 flagellar biosynthesis protein FlhF [Bacillus wiedmannii]